MTPGEASLNKNERKVFPNLYGNCSKHVSAKFNIGGKVFDKGLTPNWTEEIFIIDEVLNTNPGTYKLVDMREEKISSSFYQEELLRTNQDIFRIEKVIRRDKKKALVKWSGYPDKFNSWVPLSDLHKLI